MGDDYNVGKGRAKHTCSKGSKERGRMALSVRVRGGYLYFIADVLRSPRCSNQTVRSKEGSTKGKNALDINLAPSNIHAGELILHRQTIQNVVIELNYCLADSGNVGRGILRRQRAKSSLYK